MDAQLIEQLDRRRYKTLFWQTVGFAILFAGVIAGPYVTNETVIAAAYAVTGLGAGLFLAATFKVRQNESRIKSDPALREALNNELIRLYGYKSLMWSFYTTLITAASLFLISTYWRDITTGLALLITMYAACVSLKIAQLAYLRK